MNQSVIIYHVETVSIDAVIAELDLMMRVEFNEDKVLEYTQALLVGSELPPLDCGKVDGMLLLYDGFIRLSAYRKYGATEVKVRVRDAESRDDIVLWAVKANAHEGLKRTNADKQRSVELLLATDKYCDMPATDVANAAGVHVSTVIKYRKHQEERLSIRNPNSDSPKKVLTKRGQRRPAKYRKRNPKPPVPIRPPPTGPMQWPTAEQVGLPPPELRDQPHPDHPGLTYLQAFTRQNKFVQLFPADTKRRLDNQPNTRMIIGLVRDVGAVCKQLCEHLPSLAVNDLVDTLANMESRGLWLRKLNQYRSELVAALPYIQTLLDATKPNEKEGDDHETRIPHQHDSGGST